jgi:hypothetical protein
VRKLRFVFRLNEQHTERVTGSRIEPRQGPYTGHITKGVMPAVAERHHVENTKFAQRFHISHGQKGKCHSCPNFSLLELHKLLVLNERSRLFHVLRMGLKGIELGLGRIILIIQSQSHVTTDGQSVSLSWCRAPSGVHDQIS